jgi:hypothetical protein
MVSDPISYGYPLLNELREQSGRHVNRWFNAVSTFLISCNAVTFGMPFFLKTMFQEARGCLTCGLYDDR